MTLLEQCLNLRADIRDIDDDIEESKATLYYPKGQDLSGMPKGEGSGESIIDKLITKKGKLEKDKSELVKRLNALWLNVETVCKNAHISRTSIMLIKYRYYYGLSWKTVRIKMCEYTKQEWNENKVFRIHRAVLCKINNEIDKSA